MITIYYLAYGKEPKNCFTVSEKVCLYKAMFECNIISKHAMHVAKSDFNHYLNNLKLWFGDAEFETIQYVKHGIKMMHEIISDNQRQLKFIDARGKKLIDLCVDILPSVDLYEKDQNISRELAPSLPDVSTFDLNGYVHQLNNSCYGSKTFGHIGSGINIYITDITRVYWHSIESITHFIYHELTHKILKTSDLDRKGSDVYGIEACKELARNDSAQALKNADSWSYFVTRLDKYETCIIL
ncbi:MAG: hypothetical protein KAH18_12755 [Psychromonas sp.]|nr:hypothetical protein [Psychromonas sp.]